MENEAPCADELVGVSKQSRHEYLGVGTGTSEVHTGVLDNLMASHVLIAACRQDEQAFEVH